ncbi:capsule assembly Wzi family protein [Shivajiella indica]|uniref:Capsule assembly Wzi family protein n=1 Tax=Shivajiella indica TaxID=872115 RepID=A0ABW5BG28_9BACT
MFHRLNYSPNRPYGWGDGPMIPSKGLQYYGTIGFYSKILFFNIQFQPEFVLAQNLPYEGFSDEFDLNVIRARFRIYNFGDYPERFGSDGFTNLSWGQSKFTAQFGAFEAGISTQNIWWGPGQWNALIFSNNAQGFPHLTINTVKPAKTFLGNFEGQILSGRLQDSGFVPTQFEELNNDFFRQFSGDWRYLNAINISYNPKWIPGLFVGVSRTFQQYNNLRTDSFGDIFPIFEGFQKERLVEDPSNSGEFDQKGQDQQLSGYFRYFIEKAKFEFYFEYGRRDHALNWREAILNPEHARAYLLGFNKLFSLSKEMRFLQIRGEITHQQESINRYIRNPGLLGGLSWHTHTRARGFANIGQALGVGIGTGSNIQTIEISLVEKFNKFGILFQRLENNQDFYYRAFGQQNERQPWIDLSMGFLFDHQWKNLILNSKVQMINGRNYQWLLAPESTPEFPKGENLFSVYTSASLIYLFNSNFKTSLKNNE